MSDGYTIYNKVGTISSGSYTEVAFDQEAPQVMYFYCSNHSGMGNSVALGSGREKRSYCWRRSLRWWYIRNSNIITKQFRSEDGLAHSSGVLSLDLMN